MSDFTFRLKLRRCSRTSFGIDAAKREWSLPGTGSTLVLSSGSDEMPLREAETLYLSSSGWPTAEEATSAASRYGSAFLRAFARLRLGVDEGNRGPSGGGWTNAMIQKFWDDDEIRVINDRWGLLVYETEPKPVFSSSSGDIGVLVPEEHFERIIDRALDDSEVLSGRERVSLDLFNASFFQKSADSRLLMLMMALEALLVPSARSASAVAHVDQLIALTTEAAGLDVSERASIIGILGFMRNESIRQTGLKLVGQLGDRIYADRTPANFFDYCYGLRSSLAHGALPLPTHGDVGFAAANLEVMVSDLLAGSLRDVDPNVASSG